MKAPQTTSPIKLVPTTNEMTHLWIDPRDGTEYPCTEKALAVMENQRILAHIVSGAYAAQKVRVQIGNRVVASFKEKLGYKNGIDEETNTNNNEDGMSKDAKDILNKLRVSYKRITDGVASMEKGRLPNPKKIDYDDVISNYSELSLVSQYEQQLSIEENTFKNLEKVLRLNPIYTEYLSEVRGVGPAMAGILLAELNFVAAMYPSSFVAVSGLDTVPVGTYTDGNGGVHKYHQDFLLSRKDIVTDHDGSGGITYLAEGKYPVRLFNMGRNKEKCCMVEREYINREGKKDRKMSITFKPMLKAKLLGVLATSFLMAGNSNVDGKPMSSPKRLELAKSEGFEVDVESDVIIKDQVIAFLKQKGHDVDVGPTQFGKDYYDYKRRLYNMPVHRDKSDKHIHNMAIRHMMRIFLQDLYKNGKAVIGMPAAMTYEEAKLGLVHKKLSPGKIAA